MYPSDFAAPAPAYDPLARDLFFSVPPILLLLGLVLLVLALAGGWYGRERMGPRPHDPCEAIYDAVRRAAEDALKASRDDVRGKARRLIQVLDRRLGGVLALAGGAEGPWRDIRRALEPESAKGHDHDHGHARPAADLARADLVVINTGKLILKAGETPDADRPAPGEKPGHPHSEKDHDPAHPPQDARDEVARLRAALHAFADHWRDRPARLAELRRARADLC